MWEGEWERGHSRVINGFKYQSDYIFATEAVSKLHDSRSRQNRATLKHERRSQDEWRQLRTRSVAKLATPVLAISSRTEGGGDGGGGRSLSVVLRRAILWQLPYVLLHTCVSWNRSRLLVYGRVMLRQTKWNSCKRLLCGTTTDWRILR
jgi:hypothetical protein